MALASCSSGRFDRLWDSCYQGSKWEPFEMVLYSPSRSLPKRGRPDSKPDALAKRPKTNDGGNVDWLETDDAHVFKADLPGYRKEDIKVVLQEDQVLQISAERSREDENKGETWHVVERSHGKFLRRFRLPGTVQGQSITAKVEDGVLTVTAPKTQPKTPETRSIEVA